MNANFRRWLTGLGTLAALAAPTTLASDAATSATAGGRTHGRNGNATATAQYTGDIGFARTDSRSGRVNLARGVAVGVDEDGLSLSVSNAVAPRGGPGLATNFNMTIGRDGQVSSSGGVALADGPLHRSVTAGGETGNGHATSFASGSSDRFGRSEARTWSDAGRAPVLRAAPPERERFRSHTGHTTARRVAVIKHGWRR